MKEEIIIAGFGGQGVLSMGKILAYSGIMQDQEVAWMPSYGPEMRGGTCNVSVILSDKKISSPILSKFDTAIILNQQSLDKFESRVKPGGLLVYDPNGITHHPTRTDIQIYKIDAADEAAKLGNAKDGECDSRTEEVSSSPSPQPHPDERAGHQGRHGRRRKGALIRSY